MVSIRVLLLPACLVWSMLVLCMAASSTAGTGKCKMKLAWSSIAKEIAKVSDKASRKFSCPSPTTVRCHKDGCSARYHDGSAVPHTCNLRRLNLDIATKVTQTRAKLDGKYGCDSKTTLSCAEGQSGWWTCTDVAQTLLQKSTDQGSTTGHRGCNEQLLLDEISEEVHDALARPCSFVTSVTCDDAATHQCSFGVDLGETRTCDRDVKQKITKKVHKELQEAKQKYGCNVHHTLICEYNKPYPTPTCTFADLASQPSHGEYEDHQTEL